MNAWQKAMVAGAVVELALLLLSGLLLMLSATPAGPEGILAQLSELVQFPGSQIMEKIEIKSFPVTAFFMAAINWVMWTGAAFVFFGMSSRKTG